MNGGMWKRVVKAAVGYGIRKLIIWIAGSSLSTLAVYLIFVLLAFIVIMIVVFAAAVGGAMVIGVMQPGFGRQDPSRAACGFWEQLISLPDCSGEDDYLAPQIDPESIPGQLLSITGKEIPAYIGIVPPPHVAPDVPQPGGYGRYDVLRGVNRIGFSGVVASIAVGQLTGPPVAIYDPFGVVREGIPDKHTPFTAVMERCVRELDGQGFFNDPIGSGSFAVVITQTIRLLTAHRDGVHVVYRFGVETTDAAFLCIGYRMSLREAVGARVVGLSGEDPEQELRRISDELDRMVSARLRDEIARSYQVSAIANFFLSIAESVYGVVFGERSADYSFMPPAVQVVVTGAGDFSRALFYPTPTPTPTPTRTPVYRMTPIPSVGTPVPTVVP